MVRRQFEAYLDKVFGFADLVAGMPEGRTYPLHPWEKVFDAVFLGSACQFATLHRIEFESRDGALSKRIGPISEDMLGYAMQRQDIDSLFALGCTIAQRLKRNGVLGSEWAMGRMAAAVDGIEICSSYARCCDACLERKVERKVDGELRECLQYYHRVSAVTLVSTPIPVFLGIRFQQAGETEVACLPNAQVTDDKFHVDSVVDEAVDQVRRLEQKTAPELAKSRYVWLKNPEDLNERQWEKFDALDIANSHLKTARAYEIRLPFQDLFNQPAEKAKAFLDKWYFWATHSRLPPIIKVAKTIRKHQDGILRWFISGINNGILEGINSLVQAAKAKARGYRHDRNLATIVYLIAGKLDLSALRT